MKYILLLLALSGCTRLVPISDTSTTKTSTDTTRTPITVNIPASRVSVSLNIDSLLSAAKGQNKVIVVKGQSGRSSYDVAVKPNGSETVNCHCADSTLKVMQLLVRQLIEKEHTVVQEEKPTVLGKLASDVRDGLFWVLLAGGVVVALVLTRK